MDASQASSYRSDKNGFLFPFIPSFLFIYFTVKISS